MLIADCSPKKYGALVVVAISLALVTVACGSPSSANSSSSTTSGHTVQVSETEWSISIGSTKLSKRQGNAAIPAGTVTFKITNSGSVAHELEIQGNGIDKMSSTVEPGASTTLTVHLTPGKYEVWCPIPGHQQAGMDGFATAS